MGFLADFVPRFATGAAIIVLPQGRLPLLVLTGAVQGWKHLSGAQTNTHTCKCAVHGRWHKAALSYLSGCTASNELPLWHSLSNNHSRCTTAAVCVQRARRRKRKMQRQQQAMGLAKATALTATAPMRRQAEAAYSLHC